MNFYRARHERKHAKRLVVKKSRSGPLTQADIDSLFCTWDDLLFETPSASYGESRFVWIGPTSVIEGKADMAGGDLLVCPLMTQSGH